MACRVAEKAESLLRRRLRGAMGTLLKLALASLALAIVVPALISLDYGRLSGYTGLTFALMQIGGLEVGDVVRVDAKSPASGAGIREGDRIVEVNGQALTAKLYAGLRGSTAVGDTITYGVLRGTEPSVAQVRLSTPPFFHYSQELSRAICVLVAAAFTVYVVRIAKRIGYREILFVAACVTLMCLVMPHRYPPAYRHWSLISNIGLVSNPSIMLLFFAFVPTRSIGGKRVWFGVALTVALFLHGLYWLKHFHILSTGDPGYALVNITAIAVYLGAYCFCGVQSVLLFRRARGVERYYGFMILVGMFVALLAGIAAAAIYISGVLKYAVISAPWIPTDDLPPVVLFASLAVVLSLAYALRVRTREDIGLQLHRLFARVLCVFLVAGSLSALERILRTLGWSYLGRAPQGLARFYVLFLVVVAVASLGSRIDDTLDRFLDGPRLELEDRQSSGGDPPPN